MINRRLQDDAAAADTTTEATTDSSVVSNYNCVPSFIMGPSTLSGYDNLVVGVVETDRDTME